MIVSIRSNGSDRFVDVMRERGGKLMVDRNEAIREMESCFNASKYYSSIDLVEMEGETEEDFYKKEEEDGGYGYFWSIER